MALGRNDHFEAVDQQSRTRVKMLLSPPEVYRDLHSTLTNISDGIEAPLNQLSDLLDQCFPIFSSVLHNPPPAETDRTKLLARTRSSSFLINM